MYETTSQKQFTGTLIVDVRIRTPSYTNQPTNQSTNQRGNAEFNLT